MPCPKLLFGYRECIYKQCRILHGDQEWANMEQAFNAHPSETKMGECLAFVPGRQKLRWANGTELLIRGNYTTEGTFPAGSSWAQNP